MKVAYTCHFWKSIVLMLFNTKIIEISPCLLKLQHAKVGTFFETQCSYFLNNNADYQAEEAGNRNSTTDEAEQACWTTICTLLLLLLMQKHKDTVMDYLSKSSSNDAGTMCSIAPSNRTHMQQNSVDTNFTVRDRLKCVTHTTVYRRHTVCTYKRICQIKI